jgi:hypothetical protein
METVGKLRFANDDWVAERTHSDVDEFECGSIAGARAPTSDTGVGVMTEGAWRYRHPEPTGAGWTHGPADPSGSKLDLSDRNLLCMSVHGDTAVVGCADHALYEIKVSTGRKLRTLYSKRCGHAEWVTSVAHLPVRPPRAHNPPDTCPYASTQHRCGGVWGAGDRGGAVVRAYRMGGW